MIHGPINIRSFGFSSYLSGFTSYPGGFNSYPTAANQFVGTTGVVSTPMSLVCSASWGEGSDYNLVPTPEGHYLLK